MFAFTLDLGLSRGRVRGPGEELAGLLVPGADDAGFDVEHPAMEADVAAFVGFGDRGVGFEVLDLHEDVELGENAEAFGGVVDALDLFELGSEGEPVGDGGEFFDRFGGEDALHGAAIGVAADDDVGDLEDGDGVFDGGRDAAHGGFVVDGGYVAGVAFDEEFAWAGVGDEVGDDAGVRAGDHEGVGLLAFSE